MANTTNLNLGKLAGTEKLKTFPTVQAGNMDTIDTAFGAGFGVSGKPTVNAEINSLADGLAIMCNGNTHAAIPAGSFAYVRGHGSLSNGLYKNNTGSTIAANATLSGSNLTADTDGGLNSVYNTLNSNLGKLTRFSGDITTGYDSEKLQNVHILQINGTVQVDITVKSGQSGWLNDIPAGIPSDYRPFVSVLGTHRINGSADASVQAFGQLNSDGTVQFYMSSASSNSIPFQFVFPYNKSLV